MSTRKPVTPEQRAREAARKRSLPNVHPVACECGWSNGPAKSSGQAAYLVRRHQGRDRCGGTPPVSVRKVATKPCVLCEKPATRPDGYCDPCHKAEVDRESPLELGGRWVSRRGIRVWIPDHDPRRREVAA